MDGTALPDQARTEEEQEIGGIVDKPIINRLEDAKTHELLEFVDRKRGAYGYKVVNKQTGLMHDFDSFSEVIAYLNDNYK